MQPGSIYFKTPQEWGIFGVSCEGVPCQITYLLDKAATVGKWANATTSYIHHFFSCHVLGKQKFNYMLTIVQDKVVLSMEDCS